MYKDEIEVGLILISWWEIELLVFSVVIIYGFIPKINDLFVFQNSDFEHLNEVVLPANSGWVKYPPFLILKSCFIGYQAMFP